MAGAKGAKIGAAEMKMPSAGAELIDLTELLARSLKGRKVAKPVAAKQTATTWSKGRAQRRLPTLRRTATPACAPTSSRDMGSLQVVLSRPQCLYAK